MSGTVTGSQNITTETVGATGTDQAGAAAVNAAYNPYILISSGSNGAGIKLQHPVLGKPLIIVSTTNDYKVYPASGDNFVGVGGANLPVVVKNGSVNLFVPVSTSQWYPVQMLSLGIGGDGTFGYVIPPTKFFNNLHTLASLEVHNNIGVDDSSSIYFTGSNGQGFIFQHEGQLTFIDNDASAFWLGEGSNKYLEFISTDGLEKLKAYKSMVLAAGVTVTGDALFAGNTSGSHDLAIGTSALGTATGVDNTAVGYQAGLNVSSGSDNVIVGSQAGGGISTTDRNIAIGYLALNTANTAADNVAIGKSALGAVNGSTGQNVGVGSSALGAMTSGHDNTAVGYHAGATLTTTIWNTAVGSDAGSSNIADENTTIGYQAGKGITTGGSNTVVGSRALSSGTVTQANIVAIGAQCMQSANAPNAVAVGASALSSATGDANTAIGGAAGQVITSGGGNVAVGRQALTGGASNVTGDFNIAIGYQAGSAVSGSDNNTINIGNIGVASTPGVTRIGTDGTHTLARIAGGLIASRSVSAKTSSPYAVVNGSAGDSRKLFTNNGAGATQITFNLPAAVIGNEFEFVCEDAGGIVVVAAGNSNADKIRYVTTAGTATTSGAGGNLTTTVQGASFKLSCQKTGFWNVIACMGTIGSAATNIVVT